MMELSRDLNTGAVMMRGGDFRKMACATKPQDAFARARRWQEENWFVQQVNDLKLAFYNYGIRFTAEDEAQREKIKKALKDPMMRLAVERYVAEVWTEWVLNDNVVSFWRSKVTPFLLMGEDCKYTDAFGNERLKVSLKHEDEDFNGSGFSRDEKDRYKNGKEILLQEENDEYYQVLTRGYRGHGFSMPRLNSVFKVLAQNESMEVGESTLSMALRRVEVQHRLGWEQKQNGPMASSQNEFSTWKKKRWDTIKKFYSGVFGLLETGRNWDHMTKLVWGGEGFDVKWFDAKKWDSITSRLMWWGGPLAWMMVSKSVNPFLLGMLKTQAAEERRRVGAHLEYTLAAGFGLTGVKLVWNNRCFYDARLAWDMVKALMLQGPLSLKTALKDADFDPATEEANKIEEAKEENFKKLTPIFDAAHGSKPGAGAGAPAKNSQGVKPPSGAS